MNAHRTPRAAIKPFALRIQPELKMQLKMAAAENARSLNAEIEHRLRSSIVKPCAPAPVAPAVLHPGQRVALQVDGHGVLAATVLGQTPTDRFGPPPERSDEPRSKYCEPDSQENWSQ